MVEHALTLCADATTNDRGRWKIRTYDEMDRIPVIGLARKGAFGRVYAAASGGNSIGPMRGLWHAVNKHSSSRASPLSAIVAPL
jgi:hypothetical protein